MLRKHSRVVPEAWNRYLSKLEKEEYRAPQNEHELRCFVFSECLDVMRERRFKKPYQISVDDKEIVEATKADLAIGWTDGRFVAVELKRFPFFNEIAEDIQKLRRAVETKAIFGFFLMLADGQYRYEENLDLKALGIEEDGKHSCFGWRKIRPKGFDNPLETLLVGIM